MSACRVAAGALLRSRDASTSILTILSFALPHAMLLAVAGGVTAFRERAAAGVGADPDLAQLYIVFAGFAAVLLIVPILTMGAAAARLGMTRRAENLAILRLIGLSPSAARLACVIDTLVHALVGTLIGTLVYLLTLPAWGFLHFQGLAMRVSEMLLPAHLLLAGILLMAVLAAASSWIAVRRASISPLGVARKQQANGASKIAVLIFASLVLAWLVVGGVVLKSLPQSFAFAVVLIILGLIFAGVNAFGAWSVGLLGRLMARTARTPASLIAGRRLAEDPKSVWRSFSSVALVGFIVGCVYPVAALVVQTGDGSTSLLLQDIRTGLLLTLGMSVALAAVSTAVNQASRLLDTMQEVRSLGRAGAPLSVLDRARRREILLPALLIIGGAMGIGLSFLSPVGVGAQATIAMAATLTGFLLSAVLAILLASESTRPLRARLLKERVIERS